MTDVKIRPGLYIIYWKEGGSSLASVGMLHDGTRWFAPSNWTGDGSMQVSTEWDLVWKVERVNALKGVDWVPDPGT